MVVKAKVDAYGTSINFLSDARDKTDVRPTVLGLDFISKLQPVDYRMDYRESYVRMVDVDGRPTREFLTPDGSRKRTRFHHGLIAQDVQAVIAETGVDFGGFQDHKVKGGMDVLSLGYTELIAPLIKAVQELRDNITQLEARHAAEIADLKAAVATSVAARA